MPCTTLLVGKDASYDGSTIIARNDDSGGGKFTPKKMVVVKPGDQPRMYESVISHVKIPLPDHPLRYTAVPDAVEGEGFWAAGGINEANVGMTACETISANERVLGADPLLTCQIGDSPAASGTAAALSAKEGRTGCCREASAEDAEETCCGAEPASASDGCAPAGSLLYGVKNPEKPMPGGIGEEDMVVLVLPYIRSAREGVKRLGALLEEYGTYEMNGIAFSDVNEIWYLESIGGHHWMARKVPDHACAIIPNQLSIDFFDLDDALGEQKENMCSADLKEFIEDNHLDLELPFAAGPHGPGGPGRDPFRGPHHGPGPGPFGGPDGHHQGPEPRPEECECPPPHRIINVRLAFGTHDDADHVYNTPRAWYMGRCLAPHAFRWDGPGADFTPESDDIPWCIVPERRVTVEDVKYILSSHYQGTPFDPYGSYGDASRRGAYRSIGINRTDFLAILQIRPDHPEESRAVEWLSFASNAFNVSVPFYSNVAQMPAYLMNTTEKVSTESFYWSARLIAALADACIQKNMNPVEMYQASVSAKGHALIGRYDRLQAQAGTEQEAEALRQQANEEIAAMLREETERTL